MKGNGSGRRLKQFKFIISGFLGEFNVHLFIPGAFVYLLNKVGGVDI